MRRVDLIGPPGIGKSTLYKELLKENIFVSEWDARYEYGKNIAKNRGYINYLIYNLSNYLPLIRNRVIDRFTRTESRNSLLNLNIDWIQFLNISLQVVKKSCVNEGKIYLVLRDLINKVEEVSLLESISNPEDIIMFEESLSQRLYSITMDTKDIEKNISSIVDHLPKPAIIIYLYSEYSLVLDRINNRGVRQVAPNHIGKNEEELLVITKKIDEVFKIAISKFKASNIVVISVNAENKISKQVKYIRESIDNINFD